MKTEDIEYNGQIFSCKKIIDISAMIELLSLLAKKQKYLEDKINFQEERINDKDKRISELEIMIKGVSLSKEEKFPAEKEIIPSIKQEIKNDEDDDDLYAFLNKDNKQEEKDKDNDLKEIKEIKEEKKEETHEEKKEETPEEKSEENKDEKNEEKIEEKKEIQKPEVNDNIEENNNEDNKKEEVQKEVNINIEQNQSPTILKNQNLAQTENKQTSDSNNKELNENINTNTNNNNNQVAINQNQSQTQSPSPNAYDDEILKKIVKKLKLLESRIDKIQQEEASPKIQVVPTDKTNKNKLEIKVNLLNNKIEQVEDAQNKMKKEIEKVKEKAEDFNVYDLLKNNSGDSNIDVAQGLIINLENKVFKKLGFYDLKFKKNEEDILKNKNDIQNLNNVLSNIKDICSKNTKDLNDLKNKDDENFVEINKFISEINNKIKDIDTKIEENPANNNNNMNIDRIRNSIILSSNNISTKRNITSDASNNNINTGNNTNNNLNDNNNNNNAPIIINIDDILSKITELETSVKDLNRKFESINSSNDNHNIQESPVIQELIKVIKDITTRTKELEKNMKIILGQLNIKEVYERLDTIEKDLMKKGNKYEINELNEKQRILEENEKELNYKMDQIQQFNEKIRGDMQNFIKKIEYLSGQMNRFENGDMDKNKGSIIDITKLVDLNLFNEKQKEISKKFDKVRLSFEEVARNMDEILQRLSHMPNDKDFSQFQTIIKTTIEELKLNLSKKYADKTETTKSIKFLETQIKSIQESLQKKVDGSDNWLLAKKPLNNYVCASCENIIRGELDKRSEFVPWNKYPNREEKSYRYGHGFSRMLQLINEDRKKEMREKDSMSDGGSDSEPMLKLPKLKRLHINSGKLKNNNAASDDENNIPFDKQGTLNNNDLDPIPSEERPKIMKIYKRNKNVAQSSYLSRMDKIKDKESLANLIVKTLPSNPKEGIGQNEMINVQTNEE